MTPRPVPGRKSVEPPLGTGMSMAETIEGLPYCPHWGTANPASVRLNVGSVPASAGRGGELFERVVLWAMYRCTTCHDVILVESEPTTELPRARLAIRRMFPQPPQIAVDIPNPARRYLQDAQSSLHASSASILSSNSAIDAMLKTKGFPRYDSNGKEHSLNSRINEAAEGGVLTKGMAEWAHAIRVDANDQRHADDNLAALSNEALRRKAEGTLNLAKAIGEFLFVIPAMVEAGKKGAAAS
jgi:hypothetical protein